MAEIVHASFGRKYRSREMAALHGFPITDVVIPSSTRLVEDSEGNLATGNLNAFNYVSASGLDVTIDTGEAVVDGAYLAIDAQSTVTVTDNTTTTIYVGWQDGVADNVIVGVSGDFSSDDHKTAIWDITASSGSVTGQTDQRNTDDFRIENEVVQALVNFTSDEAFTGYPLGASDVEIDEEIRDVIGAALAGGTNISLTVDDAGDTITIDGTDTQLTTEQVQDIVGGLVAGGSNITVTYDDAGNALTIDTDALDAEQVEDQVNTLLTAGTNIALTYDDVNGALTIDATDTQLTNEQVEDIVGALVVGGNAITATYDDAGGTLTIAVTANSIGTTELSFDPATQTELNNHAGNASAHHAKYTDTEAQEAALIWAEGFAPGFAGPFYIGT